MLTIRSMQFTDIDKVYDIEFKAHKNPWTREIFNDCILVGYDCQVLIQKDINEGESIIGYTVARKSLTVYHILNLCIAPDLQGQGLGNFLLKAIMDKLRDGSVESIILEVRPSNERAIALYQKHGFLKDSIKKDYYQNATGKEDAWLLRKILH